MVRHRADPTFDDDGVDHAGPRANSVVARPFRSEPYRTTRREATELPFLYRLKEFDKRDAALRRLRCSVREWLRQWRRARPKSAQGSRTRIGSLHGNIRIWRGMIEIAETETSEVRGCRRCEKSSSRTRSRRPRRCRASTRPYRSTPGPPRSASDRGRSTLRREPQGFDLEPHAQLEDLQHVLDGFRRLRSMPNGRRCTSAERMPPGPRGWSQAVADAARLAHHGPLTPSIAKVSLLGSAASAGCRRYRLNLGRKPSSPALESIRAPG